jgi:hypothetical protein
MYGSGCVGLESTACSLPNLLLEMKCNASLHHWKYRTNRAPVTRIAHRTRYSGYVYEFPKVMGSHFWFVVLFAIVIHFRIFSHIIAHSLLFSVVVGGVCRLYYLLLLSKTGIE